MTTIIKLLPGQQAIFSNEKLDLQPCINWNSNVFDSNECTRITSVSFCFYNLHPFKLRWERHSVKYWSQNSQNFSVNCSTTKVSWRQVFGRKQRISRVSSGDWWFGVERISIHFAVPSSSFCGFLCTDELNGDLNASLLMICDPTLPYMCLLQPGH